MNRKLLISLIVAFAGLGVVSTALLFVDGRGPLGSVAVGGDFYATTTDTQAVMENYRKICPAGSLGQVTITKTGAGSFNLYDATSTRTNGDWATTTIASFGASPTVGTYIFDAVLKRGLLIEFVDGAGLARSSSTIMCR